ncbi:MAG: hypothetical protein KA003_18255 [Caldilineaceae bacterium]|nr:hypothetical protein [Caldilineaceae bacterium]
MAQPDAPPVVVLTQPDGVNDKVAEGDDFASRVLGDPWDMAEISDIYNEKTVGLADLQMTSGLLTAVSRTDDPGIYLLWPGWTMDVPNVGKLGANFPINADYYSHLSFRMYASQPGHAGLIWFQDAQLGKGRYGASQHITVEPGWQTYVVTLQGMALTGGDLPWAGQIQGLRLDPINAAGVEIKIDWVRLSAEGTTTSRFPITWAADGPGIVNFYADTDQNWDNGVYAPITYSQPLTLPLGTSSFSWQGAVLPPNHYYVAAESGLDFASLTFHDAWDMAQAEDVGFVRNGGDVSVTEGMFVFTSTNDVPYFWPSYDYLQPIDTQVYSQLTLRMYSSVADAWRVSWWGMDEQPYDFAPDPLPTEAGWHTYTLNLAGSPDWTGQVRNLVIRPAYTTGVEIRVDWIALSPAIPGLVVNGEADLGTVRTHSPGPMTILTAPRMVITQPSMGSGEDYATATFSNPWDMASPVDIEGTEDLFGYTFNGDRLQGTAGITGDNQIFLRTGGFNTQTPIDTSRYRYLTYRLFVAGKQDTIYGWVARLLWWGPFGAATHKDIVINEGWNTYQLDLGEAGGGTVGWLGAVSALRFDPQEIPAPTTVILDDVYLRAMDRADTLFEIRWAGEINPATLGSTVVDLYFDTDQEPSQKSLIQSGVSAGLGRYAWNTVGVAAGEYYIHLVVRDGIHRAQAVSQTPVKIQHGAAQASPLSPSAARPPLTPKISTAAPPLSGTWAIATSIETVNALTFNGTTLWAGTGGGLVQWMTASDTYTLHTTVDGLADNTVTALVVVSDTLWVGTENGLSRRTALGWVTLADGPQDPRITALVGDRAGGLWVGTYAGLDHFDGSTWHRGATGTGLDRALVRGIAVRLGAPDQIWVATDGDGVWRYDGTSWSQMTKTQGLADNHVWAVTAAPNGDLWAGTFAGVSRFNGTAWSTFTTTHGLPADYVRAVAVDASGNVWVGTLGGGLARYNGDSWTAFGTNNGLPSQESRAVAVDPGDGHLWAGAGSTLAEYDGNTWESKTLSAILPHNYVPYLAKDPAGSLWAGTHDGIMIHDAGGWESIPRITTADGLPSNHIQAIFFDADGNPWVGTDLGVAVRRNGVWQTLTEERTAPLDPNGEGLIHNNVTAINQDRAGNMWFGTWRGTSKWDGGTGWTNVTIERGLADSYVYDIAIDRDGSVWVATLGGISHFHGSGNETLTNYTAANGLSDSRTRTIAIDRQGTKWIGTFRGVTRYDGTTWTHWDTSDGLAADLVFDIAVDPLGFVWFATYGGGISRLDGQRWFTLTTAQGLADNYAFAVLPDGINSLWIGTWNGVSQWTGQQSIVYLPALLR